MEYFTSSFYESAFLYLRLGLRPRYECDGDRVRMGFGITQDVMSAVGEYQAGRSRVEPRAFARCIQDIKAGAFKQLGRGV